MKKYLIGLGVIGFIIGAAIYYGVSRYNNLVTLNNEIDAQWAQVDSVLQRRYDSINQTIGSIKIANKSEQDAITKITEARKIYVAASGNTEAQVAAANNYGGALNGLLLARSAVQEAYPTLKTPELVGGLIAGVSVEGNENRINVERQRYNEYIKNYNNVVKVFPSSLFAGMFGFKERSYYNLTTDDAKVAPTIGSELSF